MATNPVPNVNPAPQAALAAVVSSLSGLKAGWRTTEFWLSLAGILGVLLAALAGKLPAQWAAVIAPVAAGFYQISRGAEKSDHRDALTAFSGQVLDHLTQVVQPAPLAMEATLESTTDAAAHEKLDRILAALPAAPEPAKCVPFPAHELPPNSGAFITPGLCLLTAALSALACLLFGGCESSGTLKAHVASLAKAEGKALLGIANKAADAEAAKLNAEIESSLK